MVATTVHTTSPTIHRHCTFMVHFIHTGKHSYTWHKKEQEFLISFQQSIFNRLISIFPLMIPLHFISYQDIHQYCTKVRPLTVTGKWQMPESVEHFGVMDFFFGMCLCVCIFTYVDACAHLCACMWRLEAGIETLPLLFTLFIYGAGSPAKSRAWRSWLD